MSAAAVIPVIFYKMHEQCSYMTIFLIWASLRFIMFAARIFFTPKFIPMVIGENFNIRTLVKTGTNELPTNEPISKETTSNDLSLSAVLKDVNFYLFLWCIGVFGLRTGTFVGWAAAGWPGWISDDPDFVAQINGILGVGSFCIIFMTPISGLFCDLCRRLYKEDPRAGLGIGLACCYLILCVFYVGMRL